MARMSFNVNPEAPVIINGCRGDLRIRGGDRTTVEVSGDRSLEGRVTESGGALTINGYNGDLTLDVGAAATVVASRIAGDVAIENVTSVELQSVGGDLSVKDAAKLRADEVGGDLEVELHHVHDGAAEIGRVGGDLRVEHAATLNVGTVGGDAELIDVEQLVGLGRIGGDLRLEWAGKLAGAVSGAVGGDADIELGAGASFVLRATVGGDISGDGTAPAPAAEAHTAEDDAATASSLHGWDLEAGGGELTAAYGAGGDELRLTVGGDLELHGGRVTNSSFNGRGSRDVAFGDFGIGAEMKRLARDLKAMGRELARDLAREMRATTRGAGGGRPRVHLQVNDKTFHFDAEQIDRITREAREAAASGIAMAQEAVERALVNLVAANRTWGAGPGAPPRPPVPPRAPRAPHAPVPSYTGQTVRIERETPPASQRSPEEASAEKLAILRMVSEGRLGVDEAEVMLRALEERA